MFKKIFNKIFNKKIEDKKPKINLQEEEETKFYIGGMNKEYIFDFLNFSAGNTISSNTISSSDSLEDMVNDSDSDFESMPKSRFNGKIKVKPIDVVNELERTPTNLSLANIEDKLNLLRTKSDLISQNYAKREINALIERIENRKIYPDNKQFFDSFDNTTDEKIDNLLSKYELVMKPSDIFIPEFPEEAIKIMSSYTNKCMDLFNKKPVYYVIAEEDNFRKVWDKRDPILLVQSPFGFYWQILGAWDQEMLILSEL